MSISDQFLSDIEAFLIAKEMSATAFGTAALRDPRFVFDIRDGKRSPSLRTIERVHAWMAEQREAAA